MIKNIKIMHNTRGDDYLVIFESLDTKQSTGADWKVDKKVFYDDDLAEMYDAIALFFTD